MRRLSCLCIASIIAWPSLAQAHFLWVAARQEKTGGQSVQVYFSEGADAGEANLIERIAHARAWVRTAKGEPVETKLSVKKEEEFGLLFGPAGTSKVECLEAVCKYGVITRGEKASLLNYYAKWLAASPENFKALGRSEKLPLDIVPDVAKDAAGSKEGTQIEVLWQGKPAEGSQVVVIDAGGKKTTHTLGKEGRLSVPTSAPGTYAIRARWIEEKPGEEDGKTFSQRSHYTTLVLEVPSTKDVPRVKAD